MCVCACVCVQNVHRNNNCRNFSGFSANAEEERLVKNLVSTRLTTNCNNKRVKGLFER